MEEDIPEGDDDDYEDDFDHQSHKKDHPAR